MYFLITSNLTKPRVCRIDVAVEILKQWNIADLEQKLRQFEIGQWTSFHGVYVARIQDSMTDIGI